MHSCQQTVHRKQREVKNAYVDIDSVAVQPGLNYCDWIQITKQQLKEREKALLNIKRREIEDVINAELDKHAARKHASNSDNINTNKVNESKFIVIPPNIFNNTLHTLDCKIDEWNGVNLLRRKSPISRYRDYFIVGRNWISQAKTKIFGDLFWIHFFEFIHETLNDEWLEINVIHAIFNGTISYSNTKAITLINGGTVLHSQEIRRYLLQLHHLLQVKQWIRNEETRGNYKKKAQAIIKRIQNTLKEIISSWYDIKKPKSPIIPILGLMPRFSVKNETNPASYTNNTMPQSSVSLQSTESINSNIRNIPINNTHSSYGLVRGQIQQRVTGINYTNNQHVSGFLPTEANIESIHIIPINNAHAYNHNYGLVRGETQRRISERRYSPMISISSLPNLHIQNYTNINGASQRNISPQNNMIYVQNCTNISGISQNNIVPQNNMNITTALIASGIHHFQ